MFKHFKDNLQHESERETAELGSVRISTRNENAASLNVEGKPLWDPMWKILHTPNFPK